MVRAYPRRYDVPVIILVTLALLVAGWFMPTIRTTHLLVLESDYSIWQTVTALWKLDDYLLSIIIFGFSMLFPAAKLLTLLWMWFVPARDESRRRALKWLEALGRWSMLDVFVVAVIIVLVQAHSLLDAEPRAGIYVFAAAIGLSMLVSMYFSRLAKKVSA